MTTTEQIIAVATGLGWQASTTKYENRVVFDFQQYTPKGQDFNVSVEMKDGDLDRFLCELEDVYKRQEKYSGSKHFPISYPLPVLV